VSMRVDEVRLNNGLVARREVVDHPGAVVIVALDSDDQVYLVEQYRHPIGRTLLELPAGTLEPGEEPLQAAKRELREEVGAEAREWSKLGTFYSTPGFCSESLHAFLARDLTYTECEPDDDEELRTVRLALSDLRHASTELVDSKSLASLYLLMTAESRLGNER